MAEIGIAEAPGDDSGEVVRKQEILEIVESS